MGHVGSLFICSIRKALPLQSAADGHRNQRGGNCAEWLGQPHPPCTKSDPTWSAEGWRWCGEVGGENGRLPPDRVDGALMKRRSQCKSRRGCSGTEHARVRANSRPIVTPMSSCVRLCNQTPEPRCTICVSLLSPFPRDLYGTNFEQSCHQRVIFSF